MLEDIAPLTPAPPGFASIVMSGRSWIASPTARLQHRTLQIAMDGSQKIPVRWLPVLREARRRGAPVPHLVVALASGSASSPAGTRPAGNCRSTIRWPRACAPA